MMRHPASTRIPFSYYWVYSTTRALTKNRAKNDKPLQISPKTAWAKPASGSEPNTAIWSANPGLYRLLGRFPQLYRLFFCSSWLSPFFATFRAEFGAEMSGVYTRSDFYHQARKPVRNIVVPDRADTDPMSGIFWPNRAIAGSRFRSDMSVRFKCWYSIVFFGANKNRVNHHGKSTLDHVLLTGPSPDRDITVPDRAVTN